MPPPTTLPAPSPGRILSSRASAFLFGLPIAIAVAFVALLANPRLRPLHQWMLAENHPVEMLTFLSLFAAGLGALWMSRQRRFTGGGALTSALLAIFGIGLLLAAMEEISWGQTFFNFDAPDYFAENNRQGEVNLHNLPLLHGHNSLLRLAFAIGGLVGMMAARRRRFERLAPPRVFLSWFSTLLALAGFDVFDLFHPMGPRLDLLNEQITEVTEMLIGLTALFYVGLWFWRDRDKGAHS